MMMDFHLELHNPPSAPSIRSQPLIPFIRPRSDDDAAAIAPRYLRYQLDQVLYRGTLAMSSKKNEKKAKHILGLRVERSNVIGTLVP